MRWRIGVVLTGIMIAFITGSFISLDSNHGFKYYYIPDNTLSVITLSVMGWVLYKTFYNRNFKITAYLSSFIIMVTLYAQLLQPFPTIFQINLPYAIEISLLSSKVSLMCVFFALSSSWIYEREDLDAKTFGMAINLLDMKDMNNKFPITLKYPGKYEDYKNFQFSDQLFFVLFKFCYTRKRNINYGWLDKDEYYYSEYVKRIADEFKLNQIDIFENCAGQYRIRILPENIFINDKLYEYPKVNQIREKYNS